MRILVFDLDNTLCDIALPVLDQNVQMIKNLAKKHKIVLCSGKPTYYLCGFARQLGLRDAILVGENGAVIQFGVDLPPEKYFVVTQQKQTVKKLHALRQTMQNIFGDKVWFQPNEVALTPFPKDEVCYEQVREFLSRQNLADCIIYDQGDCFDVLPCDVNKAQGLDFLAKIVGASSKDFFAVGDSANDYPMFDFAGVSVGINLADKTKADHNFASINDALAWLTLL